MPEQPPNPVENPLMGLVELWWHACADFVALVRDLPPDQWDQPTDLPGWSVQDNVAHVAHLEAVLAGEPEESGPVPDDPRLASTMSRWTEQGVLARRGRDLPALVEEIEHAVARRYAALLEDPPLDGGALPPRTVAGARWDIATLLRNRPFDVWMHEQDIRRAVRRPGGYATPAAAHAIDVLGAALPMVVGKRVAPPAGTTVQLAVPDAGRRWTVRVQEAGRAARVEDTEPTDATVVLGPQDFVVLAGGRRPAARTTPRLHGDVALARRLLESLAVTP